MEVDERFEVGQGRGGGFETDLAGRLGPTNLAADLVALLLVERREEVIERAAHRQGHHGTDVLALDVERPAGVDLGGAEGSGEGIDRWIAAAQASQVHDVPVAGRGGSSTEIRHQGLGHGIEVPRGRQDRGVVRVVRGAEEDGRGRRGHRGQFVLVSVTKRRVPFRVGGLDLMTMHEREDGHGIRIRAPGGIEHDRGLVVGIRPVGIPPGAMEGPGGERRGPRCCRGEAVPDGARDVIDGPTLDDQAHRRLRGGREVRNGLRTGRLR